MPGVTWLRLSLIGFGGYRGKVTVELDPGFNVLLAPNEAGKSTLVAGLEAVLFGLKRSSDPSDFGTARFRHRENPTEFTGEVEFLDGSGRHWRLWRRFEDHSVVLWRYQNGRWVEEWRGTHNPEAKKKNDVYPQKVLRLLGVYTRELFEATFCVGQPLPEIRQLQGEVQRLLSGSGGHYQDALNFLQTELRKITRFKANFIGGQNDRNPAQLEQLEEEIKTLTEEIERAQTAADSRHTVKEIIHQLEEEQLAIDNQLKEKNALLLAWEKWQNYASLYKHLLEKQLSVRDRFHQAEKLSQEIKTEEAEAREIYPEWSQADTQAPADLKNLLARWEKFKEKEAEWLRLQEEVENLERERQALSDQLAQEYGDVTGRPDLLNELKELKASVEKRRAVEETLRQLDEVEKKARLGLAQMPDLSSLGHRPQAVVDSLRTTAQLLSRAWTSFEEKYYLWQKIRGELEGELAVFAGLPPAALDYVTNYQGTRTRLEAELEQTRKRHAEILAREESYQKLKADYQRDFGDLEGLNPEAEKATQEKPWLEERLRQGERELALRQGQKRQLRLLSAAGLALPGLFLGWYTSNVFFALGAVVLLGLLGWVLGGVLIQRRLAGAENDLLGQLETWRRQLQAAETLLAGWAHEPAERLAELGRRLRERELRRRELEGALEIRPTEEEKNRAVAELERAAASWDSFLGATEPLRIRLGDVTQAWQRYQELRRQKKVLEEEFLNFVRQQGLDKGEYWPDDGAVLSGDDRSAGGDQSARDQWPAAGDRQPADNHPTTDARWLAVLVRDPARAWRIPVASLGGPWSLLGTLARITGESCQTTGEVLRWLKGMKEEKWATLAEQAAAWEEAQATLDRVRERRHALLGEAQAEDVLAQLEVEITALRQRVAPFNEATGLETVAARLEEARSRQKRITELESSLRVQQGHLTESFREKEDLAQEIASLQNRLSPVLRMVRGDPEQAFRRLEDWSARQEAIAQLTNRLSGLLSGRRLEDLKQEELHASNEALACWQNWESLVKQYPGLPLPALDADPQKLQSSFAQLQDEIRKLRTRAEEVAGLLRRHNQELDRLEGQPLPNVAAQKDLLKRKQAEAARLKLEAEALGLAYRELVASAHDYSLTYRQTLAQAATRYFSLITGRQDREVTLAEDFSVGVLEAGAPLALEQLSRGTQDQLYLALRLAVGDMIAGEVNLPFLFDDPFQNCDQIRLERIRQSLEQLAQERQVWLLSHDEKFRPWGTLVKWSAG